MARPGVTAQPAATGRGPVIGVFGMAGNFTQRLAGVVADRVEANIVAGRVAVETGDNHRLAHVGRPKKRQPRNHARLVGQGIAIAQVLPPRAVTRDHAHQRVASGDRFDHRPAIGQDMDFGADAEMIAGQDWAGHAGAGPGWRPEFAAKCG